MCAFQARAASTCLRERQAFFIAKFAVKKALSMNFLKFENRYEARQGYHDEDIR